MRGARGRPRLLRKRCFSPPCYLRRASERLTLRARLATPRRHGEPDRRDGMAVAAAFAFVRAVTSLRRGVASAGQRSRPGGPILSSASRLGAWPTAGMNADADNSSARASSRPRALFARGGGIMWKSAM